MTDVIKKPYWHISEISKATGISRSSVYKRLQEAGVKSYGRLGFYSHDVVRALGVSEWYNSMLDRMIHG